MNFKVCKTCSSSQAPAKM